MRIKWRSTLQTAFAILLMVLGVLFFVKNRGEVRDVVHAFGQAEPVYLLVALAAAVVTVFAQGYAIQLSYRAIEKHIPMRETIPLYLKRYFLTPFIPGGFSVAQYTLTKDLDHHEITTAEHAFVSSGYVLAGITSYLIVLIPVVFLVSQSIFGEQNLIYTIAKVIAVLVLVGAVLGLVLRPYLSKLIRGWLQPHIGHFHSIPLIKATLTSLLVDSAGIIMLWSGIRSLGVPLSLTVASAAYILTVLVLTISPLFQGLVVVEGILTYFLGQAGVPAGEALAGVLVFRGFQMWLPTLVGGVVYVWPYWHKAKEKLGLDI